MVKSKMMEVYHLKNNFLINLMVKIDKIDLILPLITIIHNLMENISNMMDNLIHLMEKMFIVMVIIHIHIIKMEKKKKKNNKKKKVEIKNTIRIDKDLQSLLNLIENNSIENKNNKEDKEKKVKKEVKIKDIIIIINNKMKYNNLIDNGTKEIMIECIKNKDNQKFNIREVQCQIKIDIEKYLIRKFKLKYI